MPDSALGALLKDLRGDRRLNLREIAQLADVDHAYIQRLETGVKSAPSDEVLAKLTRALKPARRDAEMLPYLAKHSDVPVALVEFVRSDPTVSFVEFRGLATLAHRGSGRPDYATTLKRLRALWADEDEDG
jgi:transcriptional regulator with XRE-family HTH domain